jgi:hypothetical protein
MSVELPKGYEPHELLHDYTGKLFTEEQMYDYGMRRSDFAYVLMADHYAVKLSTLEDILRGLIFDLKNWRLHD